MRKNTGFTRVLKAIFYSYKGLTYALQFEAAFRQEALGAAVLLPLTFWLDVTPVERLLLVISVVLVPPA